MFLFLLFRIVFKLRNNNWIQTCDRDFVLKMEPDNRGSEISPTRLPRNVSFAEPESDSSPSSSDLSPSPKKSSSVHLKQKVDEVKNFLVRKSTLKWSFVVLYNIYLAYAIYYHFESRPDCDGQSDDCWGWCDGLGFVIVITCLVYLGATLSLFKRRIWPLVPARARNYYTLKLNRVSRLIDRHLLIRLSLYVLVLGAILGFFVWDTWNDKRRLISVGGLAAIVLFGAVFSKHPGSINWRQVVWGVALQLLFGLLILRWQFGKSVLDCVSKKVDKFLAFTDAGSGFVFGFLVTQQPFIPGRLAGNELAYNVTSAVNTSKAFTSVVVFKSLSVIYFFCFVTNILFYFGVVQWVTAKLGAILHATIRTTPCESMNAASNIFLGQAVAPLLIKPYIEKLTMSEIHAVITSGFATIAGTVMAAFITFGVSPAHLLSARYVYYLVDIAGKSVRSSCPIYTRCL